MATETPAPESERAPAKMTDKELRDKAATELYTTEKTYVASLETLVKFYLKPLRTMNLISKNKVTFMFGNMEHILIINKELLDALEKRMQQWEENQALGDVMNKLVPWLRLYSEYCSNYHNVIAMVMELMEKKQSFTEWLTKTQQQNNILDMSSLLIMPIQRIPRYKLLLEQVIKYTPPTHSDYMPLKNALEKVDVVADLVNESVRKRQNLEQIVELVKKFSGKYPKHLAQMGRVLIHEGELTKLCRKVPKKRYMFLFNDLLLYGEVNKFKQYTIHRTINLYYGRIVPVEDSSKVKNGFQVVSKEKSFLVWADTPEEKAVWAAKIEEAKGLRMSNYIREEHPEAEADCEAPIWQHDGESNVCMLCAIGFTTLRRKHHCRKCGILVCGKCSEHKFELPNIGKERVCDDCWEQLSGNLTKRKSQRAKTQASPNTSLVHSLSSSLIAQATPAATSKTSPKSASNERLDTESANGLPQTATTRLHQSQTMHSHNDHQSSGTNPLSMSAPASGFGAGQAAHSPSGRASTIRKHPIPNKALPSPPSGTGTTIHAAGSPTASSSPSVSMDTDSPTGSSPVLPAKPVKASTGSRPPIPTRAATVKTNHPNRTSPVHSPRTPLASTTTSLPASKTTTSLPANKTNEDEDTPPNRPPPKVGTSSQSSAAAFAVPDRAPPRPKAHMEIPARAPPTPPKAGGA
jgi:FYVE/RhoGEF/PH domain-containing protein 5/6